ncbi:MAG: phenylalanine--tRNA ligase subunit beta, partial [Anaerovoracaceae bacterium]
RADCLSMLGMAREVAATFGGKVKYPNTSCVNETDTAERYIKVEIKNEDLCKRYVARVVKNVKIKESPWWIKERLMLSGMRPINNIVDITNFVMLEMGQPIHAFDIRNIDGDRIVVDLAKKGESFITLDENERKLSDETLMIKDKNKSVAIAGIMGGLNSEIQDDTETILIESANFDADNIRKSSKVLGLRTEASSRFEKGVDPNICRMAADRVCKIIELTESGEVVRDAVDVYPHIVKEKSIELRVKRVNDILGTTISETKMKDILTSLEMEAEIQGNTIIVKVPTVRLDIENEIDLVEEIARIFGYDNLPMTLPRDRVRARQHKNEEIRIKARNVLCAIGFNEIQTYSFIGPADLDKLKISEKSVARDFVKLINPLGEENSIMRTTLQPGILEVMGTNYSRKVAEAASFEIGTIFKANDDNKELPNETDSISLAIYGGKADFFTLKGAIVQLFAKLGIDKVEFLPEADNPTFQPGRCAKLVIADENFGILGQLRPEIGKNFGIGTRCYVAELDFSKVILLANTSIKFKHLPKYPSITRDIALLVDEEITVGEIEKSIRENSGKIFETVKLFDVYRGDQIEKEKKSLAFSIVYRDQNKTLTDEEVSKVHSKMLKVIEEKFNAKLREV